MISEMSLGRRQAAIFMLGWFTYAATYLLRKPLGVIKVDLEDELTFSKTQLGLLDSALFLPYAIAQILFSSLGDKYGCRLTLMMSLILSSISMISFGYWNNFSIFAVLLFINGLAQAQCWPNCSKTIEAWFPDEIRNTIFGIYGTCAFAGGIAGTALAVFLQAAYGWREIFIVPSCVVAIAGILVALYFHMPHEVGIHIPGKQLQPNDKSLCQAQILSWKKMWTIPMLPEVGVAVFCLKIVRYCMYMWLPMYLVQHLHYEKTIAGVSSTSFEIGGVIGSAAIGIIIDKWCTGNGLLGSGICAFLSATSLILFSATSDWGHEFNVLFTSLAGAFNCAPDSILGASVPSYLGEISGKGAGASVIGAVNGIGSLGIILQGPIIGIFSQLYGWTAMFHLMVFLSFVGSLSALKASTQWNNKL